jgi:hydroxymethylpyrimidine kinase/phosphomethylpyrimidine kinase
MRSGLPKTLLSIAGYDPSSGAGVLLDLAVFRQFGYRGMGVLTAVTAQNTQSVAGCRCLPAPFVLSQYKTLAEEASFAGIKVGMVGCRKNVLVLGRILAENRNIPVVADPVFRSSSGAWLLEKEAIPSYISKIKGMISLLTPNLTEAALLSGRSVKNRKEMEEAARVISGLVESPCYIKGGHLAKGVVDLLFDGTRVYLFKKEKIKKDVHGTGCFLSSSLICYLAKGFGLVRACELASNLTHKAIREAVQAGEGRYVFPLIFRSEKP